MKITYIISIVLLLVHTPATGSEPYQFKCVREAFESKFQSGVLPLIASEYIAREVGLDWKVERLRPDQGKDIRGFVSNNYQFCILSFSGFGEWGQSGPAEYCALDSTGLVLWAKQSSIVSNPAISNTGICALMTSSIKKVNNIRSMDIVICNRQGDTLKVKSVNDLLRRPVQRGFLREHYGYTDDGMIFYSTLNTKPEVCILIDSIEVEDYYNNTTLYVYDSELNVDYEYYLGDYYSHAYPMNIGDSDFSLHGEWNTNRRDSLFEDGYIFVSFRGARLEKRITATREMINNGIR